METSLKTQKLKTSSSKTTEFARGHRLSRHRRKCQNKCKITCKALSFLYRPMNSTSIAADDKRIQVDESFLTAPCVLSDAVYLLGEKNSSAALEADAEHFLNEVFKHCKGIALDASRYPGH